MLKYNFQILLALGIQKERLVLDSGIFTTYGWQLTDDRVTLPLSTQYSGQIDEWMQKVMMLENTP